MTLAVIVGGSPLQEHLGQPRLAWQLGWLHAGGLKEATLCLSERASAVRAAFADGAAFGVRLRYLVKEQHLGTAGAVKALGLASLPEEVLVVTGRPEHPLEGLLTAHRQARRAATIAVHPCEHAPACPPAVVGPEERLVELPGRPLVGRFPIGVSPYWLVNRALLRLVPDGKPCDFLRDVFPEAIRQDDVLAVWRAPGKAAARR